MDSENMLPGFIDRYIQQVFDINCTMNAFEFYLRLPVYSFIEGKTC